MTPAEQIANRAQIYAFWLGATKSPAVAAGLTAQAFGESSYNPKAVGDHGGAFGLDQWHGARAAAIKTGCGIDLTSLPDLNQQLIAALWELRHTEQFAYLKIVACKTAYDAGYAACRYWERPGNTAQYAIRGNIAEQIATYFAKHPITNP